MSIADKKTKLKKLKENVKNPKLKDYWEMFEKGIAKLEKEIKDVETDVVPVVEDKPKAKAKPKAKPKAKAKAKPKAKKKTSVSNADAEKELAKKVGKTEEECEDILKKFKELRAKKKARIKKTSETKAKSKAQGKTEPSGEITPEEVIKDATEKVEKKIDKKIEKVEAQAEKTEKPKANATPEAKKEAEKKVEKKVEKETKVVAKDSVDALEGMVKAIMDSLKKYDKATAKLSLIKLRDAIDKEIAKYGDGGMVQGFDIQASLINVGNNPSFAKGGSIMMDGRLELGSAFGVGGNKSKTYKFIKDDRDSNGKPFYQVIESPSNSVMAQGEDFQEAYNMFKLFTKGSFAKGGGVDKYVLPKNLKKKLDKVNQHLSKFGGRSLTEKEAIRFNIDNNAQSGFEAGSIAFDISEAPDEYNGLSWHRASARYYHLIGDSLIEISEQMTNVPYDSYDSEIIKQIKGTEYETYAEGGRADDNKAHYFQSEGTIYVDSNFVNMSKGNIPNSELKHYGYGDFYLETPNGNIDFFRVDKDIEGFTGRSHKMKASEELGSELFEAMGDKVQEIRAYAKGGSMASGGEVNGKYLDSISADKKSKILNNIAKHYGMSSKEAEEEVVDLDAENLFEYIANDNSLRMQVYNDFKTKYFAKGGSMKSGGYLEGKTYYIVNYYSSESDIPNGIALKNKSFDTKEDANTFLKSIENKGGRGFVTDFRKPTQDEISKLDRDRDENYMMAKGGRLDMELLDYNIGGALAVASQVKGVAPKSVDGIDSYIGNKFKNQQKMDDWWNTSPNERKARGYAGGGMSQGYNDKDDESIGMRNRGNKMQSRKDRRDESAGMEKSGGRRKYADVGTMDKGRRKKMEAGGGLGNIAKPFNIQEGMISVGNNVKFFKKGGGLYDNLKIKKGTFTKKAKNRGMTTKAFMKEVLSNPENYTMKTRRQAQLMKNMM